MINGKIIKAIIPARMTSSRLPGKVMLNICGKPVLQRVIERVRASKLLDGVVIATTINKDDDCIEEFCKIINCECFRGSENNVLERLIGAARATNTDIIVELTSDCPIIFSGHIDYLVNLHMQEYPYYDMTTNIEIRSFPRGFDLRIVNIEALEWSQKEIDAEIDLQHALTFIYLNPKGKLNYKVQNWIAPEGQNRPDLEITLDTIEDWELICFIYGFEEQGYNLELNCEQVISIIDNYPMMYKKVADIKRKNYFDELSECYTKQKNVEGAKKNEKVPNSNNRSRKTGVGNRTRKKPK